MVRKRCIYFGKKNEAKCTRYKYIVLTIDIYTTLWYYLTMNKVWKIAIAVIAIWLIGSAIVTFLDRNDPKPVEAQKQPTVKIYTVDELLAEANRLRAEKGVAPLTIDPRLNESAQWKAQDMADFDYFGHVRDGYHGWQKADELAPECMVSENIETQDISVKDSPFAWWVTSKPHYDAILADKYDSTGFGIVNDNGKMLYVEHFCDLP